MSERLTVVIPEEGTFDPAPIPYGVVTGEGKPDYDNIKSKGKRGGMEYGATIVLTKEAGDHFLETVMDFWKDNKPKKGSKKPANYKNIIREDDDGNFRVYPSTKTNFGEGKPNVIAIVNHEGTKLDPDEYGLIGEGSEGRLAVNLVTYGEDEDAGVSVFLGAVKLTKFVAYSGNSAANAFGSDDTGEVDGAGGFKGEGTEVKKKKKDKKDKKKKNK